MPHVSLLLVDFLDSYTHNIPSFIQRARPAGLTVSVEVVPYTRLAASDVASVAATYHGVVLSPGPGTVDCADDLGTFVPALLQQACLPVFAVCLGFQAICKQFGGSIKRLSMPHHGLLSDIETFDGKPLGRRATRYHSLEVHVTPELEANIETSTWAWSANHNDSSRTLQEIKIRGKPFWGVQYHPESVYSTNCEAVIVPFLNQVLNQAQTKSDSAQSHTLIASHLDGTSSGSEPGSTNASSLTSLATTPAASDAGTADTSVSAHTELNSDETAMKGSETKQLSWRKTDGCVDIDALLTSKTFPQKEFVLLDSTSKGDWDILSFSQSAYSFRYSCRRQEYSFTPVSAIRKGRPVERQTASLNDMWAFLQGVSTKATYVDGPDVPFWGGFMGYFSYELGLEQLGLDAHPNAADFPECDDVQLLWSSETVLFNKKLGVTYLISLERDNEWLDTTEALLKSISNSAPAASRPSVTGKCDISHPQGQDYIASIDRCQENINAGESYELCLTALSDLHFQPTASAGDKSSQNTDLYVALRKDNPAAFASYFNLGDVTFLSASPEEFLAYDATTRVANMKPIKGTLAKVRASDGSKIDMAEAEKELHQPKVIAENLMIVDLVRNDLARVSNEVSCPNLLWVEELPHMYQLVSTIEAVVSPGRDAWDLLKSTLPPGSMTGAPKRRSCQILQKLESTPRGVYSGVVGYIDVRGNCRTSVSIRNATQYPGTNHFKLGAGGAITNLSDPTDEWNERQLKASSVCRTFTQRFQILETVGWEQRTLTLWDDHMNRLFSALKHFRFKLPFQTVDQAAMSASLRTWIQLQLHERQKTQALRLSIKVASDGQCALDIVEMGSAPSAPLSVALDPRATNTVALKPFVTRKTTLREHYTTARDRAQVTGRNEVLLFRPSKLLAAQDLTTAGADDDLLTEGSYTNVAVYKADQDEWVTPASHCLPGIARQKLLDAGEIVPGEIRRSQLKAGMQIKLFNSVRGTMETVIS